MHKYKEMFEILEQYDKTREWPIGRAKINLTLSKRVIQKLRRIKEKTGKSISLIIEEAVS